MPPPKTPLVIGIFEGEAECRDVVRRCREGVGVSLKRGYSFWMV
jgi:hypothetical protein